MNDVDNKSSRVLYIYKELINGHIVTTDDVSARFNVCNRTVHRDIGDVKNSVQL